MGPRTGPPTGGLAWPLGWTTIREADYEGASACCDSKLPTLSPKRLRIIAFEGCRCWYAVAVPICAAGLSVSVARAAVACAACA
eukprot:13191976-Alexandrium_andersonii.AAC.1